MIVGGGTAGWMTAAALAHKLADTGIAVTLVESEEIGTVGVGEATVPHIRHFNASLGFDEAHFMSETQATFKLGIEFRNWGRIGDSYIHPFGVFGAPIDGAEFHHHWVRLHHAGQAAPFDHYSLPCEMARTSRFAHPSTDPASPLSTFSYAYQFDALLYARYLRRYAEGRGVRRTEGRVVSVDRSEDSGDVAAVRLADGRVLAADFFVDCSGFRGLLIEGALGAGYEDWSHWLPCDRAVAVPCERRPDSGITPYTRATALAAGWAWRIPLRHRTGNGHVYSSRFTDDDAAEAALLAELDGAPLADPRRLRFTTGKRRRQWIGNTVAIGLAAGFLEPLESTSIHLVQLAIGRLLDLFPTGSPDPVDATEFNRLMDAEYDRIRDFLILHYCATQRDDTAFWSYVRTMELPHSLAEAISLFRARGVVPLYRHGMFLEPSWLAVFLGQRMIPDAVDPRAARTPVPDSAASAQAWRGALVAQAASLPPHLADA
nr:tryptophan 7-halogenase [Sphingomonas jejuensis]